MTAMARPGRILPLPGARPPAALSPAVGALILTLCDHEAGLHLAGRADTPEIRQWVALHTGARLTGPADCRFAVGRRADLGPLDAYAIGMPDYSDRSATLIVGLGRLAADGARLTGPGIAGDTFLPLPETAAFRANARLFPHGLDFFFTCGAAAAALPRTTRSSEGN